MKFFQVCGLVLASIVALTFAFGLVIGANMLANSIWPDGSSKRYDCSVAEISPDYPVEVREGCRKLKLLEKYNGN